jgi:hypothetical protein
VAPSERPGAVLVRHTMAVLVAYRRGVIGGADALERLCRLGFELRAAHLVITTWGHG